jgi:hypothetical protein
MEICNDTILIKIAHVLLSNFSFGKIIGIKVKPQQPFRLLSLKKI